MRRGLGCPGACCEWAAAVTLKLKILSVLGHWGWQSIFRLVIAIVYIYYKLHDVLEIQANAFFSLLYTRISITPYHLYRPSILQGLNE